MPSNTHAAFGPAAAASSRTDAASRARCHSKAAALRAVAEKEGVSVEQVVGVGDGANDIPMLQAAGLGIAFRAKERTRERADATLGRSDFLGLLYLLGVSGRDMNRLGGKD